MMRTLFFSFFTFFVFTCSAQNFRGQWKGYFIDKSVNSNSFGSDRCDYVLDLDVDGSNVSGYSYTYFTSDGKKYYTICTLKGFANKKNKFIQITETQRTKTNVPDDITNSFQVHTLSWRQDGANEILEGTWKPAPGQGMGSGFGTTYLAKRQLTEISALAKRINAKKDPENRTAAVNPPVKPAITAKKLMSPARNNSIAKTTVKVPHIPVDRTQPLKPVNSDPVLLKDTEERSHTLTVKALPETPKFEKRENAVLKTVVVENATVKIELYDNGEVDGDSVSIFYNGKVLLAHKMLSTKAITLEIPVNSDEVNELVMYADNLGTIPPNTALMIVYDGTKRYEVRITSDLKQSGTIRFIHKSGATK